MMKSNGGAYLFLLCLNAFLGLFLVSGCSGFGSSPSSETMQKYWSSKQFNTKEEKFENRRPKLVEQMQERVFGWEIFKEWFRDGIDQIPSAPLPEVKPDMDAFMAESKDLKVVWFGHSSFLLNMDGVIILVDPVFSAYAAPVNLSVERFQPPVIALNELPAIDFVLISHDHYDHLDMDSIKFFADKEAIFIAPLGVGSHLKGWGIDESRIVERDWWESHKVMGTEFIATPAQHFSGRGLFDGNCTLWASWVIQSESYKIYFSGDSGYDVHFKEIGDKLGPFDIAFIESGQYDERWNEVHMLPREAVQAYRDLRARRYFPVHWGMFRLAFHTWYDPIEKLFQFSAQDNFPLVAPIIGQVIALNATYQLERWWDSVPKELDQKRAENHYIYFPYIAGVY